MQSASLSLSYENNGTKILNEDLRLNQFSLKYFEEDNELENEVVKQIMNGNVIGFFHGSFEWGPRALGNRSIIVDPRIENMKELLNQKIKKREGLDHLLHLLWKIKLGNGSKIIKKCHL